MTFAKVAAGAEGYFAQQQKRVLRGKVKPMTVFRAQLAYDLHLEPAFGSLPFSDIDEDAISDWIDYQLEAGAAPKSIRSRRGLLFSVMKHLPGPPDRLLPTRRMGPDAFLPPPDVHLLQDLELTTNGTKAHILIGQTIGQAKGMVSDPLSLVLPSPTR